MGERAFDWRGSCACARRNVLCWFSLGFTLWLLVFLYSCSSKSASELVDAGMNGAGGMEPPSAIALDDILRSELARLDIDPSRKPAQVASTGNAVFDLAARVVEGEDAITEDPPGILLTWTERLVGDYNQDGVVGIADLTPLGVHFLKGVDYAGVKADSAIHCTVARESALRPVFIGLEPCGDVKKVSRG
ncbi:hypothetical protein JW859_02350 [bacterium]|nr:hypothetical protein [bacterium]